MRITVLFKYLSQKNIHTHRTTTRKKKQHSEQIFGVIFLFLKGGYTTHKKRKYVYIFTKRKKEEKYKPGYETREIRNVHLFLFLWLLMSVKISC
jgi:hypothetical protein